MLKVDVQIESVNATDAAPFLQLEAKCFGMRYTTNSLYYWRPIVDYCWALKAVHEGRIVGGVIAMPTKQQFIYINSLFVEAKMRGLGIGSNLLRRVLRLQTSGFVLDVKSDKEYLITMYRRHGFHVSRKETNYYLDGSDRIIMRRRN